MSLRFVDLRLESNEASDCVRLRDQALLDANGWDAAYLLFLDEGHLEEAIVLLGHQAGAPLTEGWSDRRLEVDVGKAAGKTDDAEAAASFGEHHYVVASHFGKKRGPLQVARHWFARLPAVLPEGDAEPVAVKVVRDKFRLHRMVNDALGEQAVPAHPYLTSAFVAAARERGSEKDKKWARRLVDGDRPINVEGAAFRPNGNLLLGLRFPVAPDGSPLLVELARVPELFEEPGWPEVVAVWTLEGPGTPSAWAGLRAMTTTGDDSYDVVCGNLDAADKDSLLLDCHPEGRSALSSHWRFDLAGQTGGGRVAGWLVAELEGETRVEGITTGPDGHVVYVVDEDHRIGLHLLAIGEDAAAE